MTWNAARSWQRLTFRARVVLIAGCILIALVGLRIHGSSIALMAGLWAPGQAMEHFVASPLLSELSDEARESWRAPLMAQPRRIRYDEWANEGTLYSLAQFSHVPPFPVVNTNVGNGQNMLVLPWSPVLHPSALARPATWGYLLLGPERGLAWCWWSQVFGCFIALYLLVELIIPGRPWLSLLGATWFCGSAYVVCWSLWPAYVTGLGAFTLVGAYWLLRSTRPVVILGCGALVGTAFAGFCMQLYPPWQVPLGYTFLLVFAGLVWRDRLWQSALAGGRVKLSGLGLALALAAGLLMSFVISSRDALEAMAMSDYPGQRRSFGGDLPAWRLFGGFFNAFTRTLLVEHLGLNASEASGFFSLFPAVAVAAAASPRMRWRLGPVVWLLLPWTALLVYFCVAPIPQWFASVTLLSHAPGYRAQLALGLISVILSLRLLAVASQVRLGRESWHTALWVFVLSGALYVGLGSAWESRVQRFGEGDFSFMVLAICVAAALSSALLALGRARLFAALLLPAVVLTSATFNPLCVGFPDWRSSQIGMAVQRVVKQDSLTSERAPAWLAYGQGYFGPTVLHLMGARALGGTLYHPQLDLWRPLDESGTEIAKYNRFASITFHPLPLDSRSIEFHNPSSNLLRVDISPLHPALWAMGVRHVLTFGNPGMFQAPPFELVYRSNRRNFAIWDIPPPKE